MCKHFHVHTHAQEYMPSYLHRLVSTKVSVQHLGYLQVLMQATHTHAAYTGGTDGPRVWNLAYVTQWTHKRKWKPAAGLDFIL